MLRCFSAVTSHCRAWAQLRCSTWDPPGPGIKPLFPALAGGLLVDITVCLDPRVFKDCALTIFPSRGTARSAGCEVSLRHLTPCPHVPSISKLASPAPRLHPAPFSSAACQASWGGPSRPSLGLFSHSGWSDMHLGLAFKMHI